MSDKIELQKIVGEVAAAYLSNCPVAPSEIPAVISNIAASITAVGSAPAVEAPAEAPQHPTATAAQIRKSIGHDRLISFEDGKGYKTLRRHLAVKGLTPEEYRSKWGLPKDYPMVAPSYRETRSNLAKAAGFGSRAPTAPALAASAGEKRTTKGTAKSPRKVGRPRGSANRSTSKTDAAS